ncbi:MAG: hypothetical protein JWN86_4493 [Planctomycetota bacterium]|nr:hypothetical protein [Planctomycetota bacterium]
MALISPTSVVLDPDRVKVAYKEWAGICRALGSGRQSILLRKGGIAEGPAGFRPEYPRFWLYPTHLHEAQQGVREPSGEPPPTRYDGLVDLELFAVVETVARLERAEEIGALDEFHVWTDETVRSRFNYRSPGLWVLAVRVFRRLPSHRIAATSDHAGCKSWVLLDDSLPMDHLVPVLSESEASSRHAALAMALSLSPSLSK